MKRGIDPTCQNRPPTSRCDTLAALAELCYQTRQNVAASTHVSKRWHVDEPHYESQGNQMKPGSSFRFGSLAALSAMTFLARPLVAAEIDTRPLASVKADVAFPSVKWPGWTSAEESGVSNPLR